MRQSFDSMQKVVLFVVDYTNSKQSITYLYRNDSGYVASDISPDPPFVVATPGDTPDVISDRLKRLTPRKH